MKLYIPNHNINGVPVEQTGAGGTNLLTYTLLYNTVDQVFVDTGCDHRWIVDTVADATNMGDTVVHVVNTEEPYSITIDRVPFLIQTEQDLYELNLLLEHR